MQASRPFEDEHDGRLNDATVSRPSASPSPTISPSSDPATVNKEEASLRTADLTSPIDRHAQAIGRLRHGIASGGGDQYISACQVLIRLLSNIIQSPEDPKYRRLRLTNSKVKAAVVDADGALELLLACGFEMSEESLVLESQPVPLEALQSAVASLQYLIQLRNTEPTIVLPDRNTRILVPQHVDAQVPDWFFERTGADVKAAVLEAARKRDKESVLRTQAMRDRERMKEKSVIQNSSAKIAVVKVRLPEGLSLVGDFSPDEKVLSVLIWVNENLSDASQTFDLILPDRRSLWSMVDEHNRKPEKLTLRSVGFVPSITLNFRWTGNSAAVMKAVPTLHSHVLGSQKCTLGVVEER